MLCDTWICPPAPGAPVTRLTERTHSFANFLWSRKRAVEDVTLRRTAVSLERELWKKAMEKGGGESHTRL